MCKCRNAELSEPRKGTLGSRAAQVALVVIVIIVIIANIDDRCDTNDNDEIKSDFWSYKRGLSIY